MLMALTVSMGGLLERSGVMEALPETFANVWLWRVVCRGAGVGALEVLLLERNLT